jgi:hypothetical protein
VLAVHNDSINRDEVCRIYNILIEEFLNWERLPGIHGPAGLRVTRVQQYRGPKPESKIARYRALKSLGHSAGLS